MTRIGQVVNGLDRWFDAMRVEWPSSGYGGPVVHWWNHCLAYRGAGLDWRYEGIVAGYLTLHEKTDDQRWLAQAIRAGNDLLAGQLPNGHFRNSLFEQNPGEGGTPHEAAGDVALLLLSQRLRGRNPSAAGRYLEAARRNLESYWFGALWHAPSATLWDRPGIASFVPNKAATFLEAVLLLADLTGERELVERYAVPTGRAILSMQVRDATTRLDGAIAQNRLGARVVAAYYPLYIARCVPPLLALYAETGGAELRDGALAAARFVARVREPDGGYPQVLYGNSTRNRHPRWVAGAGDIVRALIAANQFGAEIDITPTVGWILRGVRPDGHIATAEGFGRVVPLISRADRFADDLGVVGWCDKAFRALTAIVAPAMVSESGEITVSGPTVPIKVMR